MKCHLKKGKGEEVRKPNAVSGPRNCVNGQPLEDQAPFNDMCLDRNLDINTAIDRSNNDMIKPYKTQLAACFESKKNWDFVRDAGISIGKSNVIDVDEQWII